MASEQYKCYVCGAPIDEHFQVQPDPLLVEMAAAIEQCEQERREKGKSLGYDAANGNGVAPMPALYANIIAACAKYRAAYPEDKQCEPQS